MNKPLLFSLQLSILLDSYVFFKESLLPLILESVWRRTEFLWSILIILIQTYTVSLRFLGAKILLTLCKSDDDGEFLGMIFYVNDLRRQIMFGPASNIKDMCILIFRALNVAMKSESPECQDGICATAAH